MQLLCTCWVAVMFSCLRSKPLRKISTPGSLARLFKEVGFTSQYCAKQVNCIALLLMLEGCSLKKKQTKQTNIVGSMNFEPCLYRFLGVKEAIVISSLFQLIEPSRSQDINEVTNNACWILCFNRETISMSIFFYNTIHRWTTRKATQKESCCSGLFCVTWHLVDICAQ